MNYSTLSRYKSMISIDELKSKQEKICVVGLGYVGLPLAVLLAKHFSVVGFDVKRERIEELKNGVDRTNEVLSGNLSEVKIEFSTDPSVIKNAKFIILAIPTPVDKNNLPDLSPVEKATITVGRNLAPGSVVVYESTVYPGVTEEICLPILEKESRLKAGEDFKIGYSPERVNPGDKEHTIDKVYKIVSSQDEESLEVIAGVYGAITKIHRASSIKVAEAAKVIENTQRDLNIALMNELSVIFHMMNIDTKEVLAAAETKWNFLKFYPGMVGGHCIGVDPYYLTFKAEQLGYKPEVILAGRRINDSMGGYIAKEVIKKAAELGKKADTLKILIAGITFKENIPDIRNSKVFDIYQELLNRKLKAEVYDPVGDSQLVKEEYGIELISAPKIGAYDVIIIAVAHDEFAQKPVEEWKKLFVGKSEGLLADLKGILNKKSAAQAGLAYWRL